MHKMLFYAVIVSILHFVGFFVFSLCAHPQHLPQWTKVEKRFLTKSNRQSTYEDEYFPVIEVKDQLTLGKLIALRFIEWVQHNPNGVVGITSGNTPEYFIKYLNYYKKNWHNVRVQEELMEHGIVCADFPKTSHLKLVQMEELYPMSDKQYQKISNYILRHYVKLLNIKPENLLLIDLSKKGIIAEKGMNIVFMSGKIDLSIMKREPNSQLEIWQKQALHELEEFCRQYDNRIRELGGIDFYIGGLAYGGQLNYNEPKGAFNSITHFTNLDYMSAAYASQDLGGIDYARGKIAITVGLETITLKPNAIMIVIAAGQAKAQVVSNAIINKANEAYPATVLQKCPNSRFYITSGASKLLESRQTENLYFETINGWAQKQIEEVIINIALKQEKSILSLNRNDLNRYAGGRLLLGNAPKNLNLMLKEVHDSLVAKLEDGRRLMMNKSAKILHTAPHHEDIMLSYYPILDNLINSHDNYFAHFTTGYNSVSDSHVLNTINRADDWWIDKEINTIFDDVYIKSLAKYNRYFIKNDTKQMYMLETTNALQSLATIYEIKDINRLKEKIRWLKDDYFPSKQPGDLDDLQVASFKGMIREAEVDRLLTIKKIPLKNVYHLRSKFYSGHSFMQTPRYTADVLPFIKIYNNIQPDMLLLLDDPQIESQSTNYKVLQIISQALRSNETNVKRNLQIIGYRNRWFSYNVEEADIFVPVSELMLHLQQKMYTSCFSTQKKSAFPSPFFAGDSAILMDTAQRINLYKLHTLLGSGYFTRHPTAEIRMARGFIFLHKMDLDELLSKADDLLLAMDLEDGCATDNHLNHKLMIKENT